MKEAPPIKNLPPKIISGGGSTTNTTKAPDELLSSLLRYNYDSFSSIKDESLDIDLSACVTINAGDPAAVLNGNSFSSTDFWRMLDENAQTSQMEIVGAGMHIGAGSSVIGIDESMSKSLDATQEPSTSKSPNPSAGASSLLKMDQLDMCFGDKLFLRPNPPASYTLSPLRKAVAKATPSMSEPKMPELLPRDLTIAKTSLKSESLKSIIKLEPLEQVPDIIIEEEKISEPGNIEITHLYKCMDCNGMMLRRLEDFTAHDIAKHRVLHVCGTCEREFDQEAGLKKHLKAHRSVEARKDSWRKCPDCGKCLKLGSMWMHRKIHSDNKKYGCDICGQKFVQKINLTHHSRVHTVEKPYECPECQKRFQERSHLQRHQKYHAQTRSYRCEKCGKMYKTERCLKVHNLVHLEQRPFACNVCDKSFISNSKLKQHSNIHTGERPFKCNYCPRDFTNFPNWLKHTRRRHKVDHKTGQQLENIPSYCTKKSTKTTKTNTTKAGTTATTTTTNTIASTITTTSSTDERPSTTKPKANQVKVVNEVAGISAQQQQQSATIQNRSIEVTKANTTPTIMLSTTNKQTVAAQKLEFPNPALTIRNNMTTTITPPPMKPTKVKRERKQLMPKQVQKQKMMPTTSTAAAAAMVATPKKETNRTIECNFPDLHGMSLTSAEEFIMEQALEMEECGLYDAPISLGETDNAISADAAAALHFKIKSEFIETTGIDDEPILLKEPNNRLLCSSLESSPYSSPASVELPVTTTIATTTSAATITKVPISPNTPNALTTEVITAPLTAFYLQPFTFGAQGTMVTRICNSNALASTANVVVDGNNTPVQFIPQLLTQPMPTTSADTSSLPPSTQALINHFFLPMTVNMHQGKQQQSVLPSVETLLFSAHANASLFAANKSNSSGTPASSPTTLATQHNLT